MVRNFIVMTTMVASICGCAAGRQQPVLTPIEVKVPVAVPVYCQVAKLNKPELPISALKSNSAPADTIRAYAATVAILKGAVSERDLVIEGCAAPTSDQPPTPQAHGAISSGAGGDVK